MVDPSVEGFYRMSCARLLPPLQHKNSPFNNETVTGFMQVEVLELF